MSIPLGPIPKIVLYTVDCFTERSAGTKFPENSYSCSTPSEVVEIVKNCSDEISGIIKVEVWIDHDKRANT